MLFLMRIWISKMQFAGRSFYYRTRRPHLAIATQARAIRATWV